MPQVAKRRWTLARHASVWNNPPISNSSRRDDGKRHHEHNQYPQAIPPSLQDEERSAGEELDYRFCWLRDATFTLYALIDAGYHNEARAWRAWLVRAVGRRRTTADHVWRGRRAPADGIRAAGVARRRSSAPVRIGNAAAGQFQLDVYGELLGALYVARKAGLDADAASWDLELALIAHLEKIWDQPDEGIWEVRGGRKQFTHSKVMVWVAFDRAVRSVEEFGLEGPWTAGAKRATRSTARFASAASMRRRTVSCRYDGAKELDASLLMIALTGFLPPSDPRVRGTVAAIERGLLRNGLVLRYDTGSGADGLPAGEGAFLACSFWLVDNYILQREYEKARALFERLLSLRNDVGLLSEEYDPVGKRQLGNFPQAFSHLALINSARNFQSTGGPAHEHSAGSAAAGADPASPNVGEQAG